MFMDQSLSPRIEFNRSAVLRPAIATRFMAELFRLADVVFGDCRDSSGCIGGRGRWAARSGRGAFELSVQFSPPTELRAGRLRIVDDASEWRRLWLWRRVLVLPRP